MAAQWEGGVARNHELSCSIFGNPSINETVWLRPLERQVRQLYSQTHGRNCYQGKPYMVTLVQLPPQTYDALAYHVSHANMNRTLKPLEFGAYR